MCKHASRSSNELLAYIHNYDFVTGQVIVGQRMSTNWSSTRPQSHFTLWRLAFLGRFGMVPVWPAFYPYGKVSQIVLVLRQKLYHRVI